MAKAPWDDAEEGMSPQNKTPKRTANEDAPPWVVAEDADKTPPPATKAAAAEASKTQKPTADLPPWAVAEPKPTPQGKPATKPTAPQAKQPPQAPAATSPTAAPKAQSPQSPAAPTAAERPNNLAAGPSGGIVRESPSGGVSSAAGGMSPNAAVSASGGVQGGGVNAGNEDGPLYIETIWAVIARFLEQKDVICSKVQMRRKQLLEDMEGLYRSLYRIHEALEKNAHLAPSNHCKDLASDGPMLARIAKVAVDAEEQDQIQKDVISNLSSRRIVFEIEAHPDKASMVAGWRKAAEDINALKTYLVEEQKSSGRRTW